MCNRYRPASITYIRDAFGFTLIEDSYAPAIGPLQQGPFIVPGRALVMRCIGNNRAACDLMRFEPDAGEAELSSGRGSRRCHPSRFGCIPRYLDAIPES